jgi:hypothetical protein
MRAFKSVSTVLIAAAALALAAESAAQGYPKRGGQRGEAGKGGESSAQRPGSTSAAMPDPFGALERELPSLKVDLMVREEQLDAWRVYARDVRDLAEMERARRRHLVALRAAGEAPPTALNFINSLVEDDRLRAEAGIELKRHVEQLYARLDDGQRRTFDRRTIQSQTEPLGTGR